MFSVRLPESYINAISISIYHKVRNIMGERKTANIATILCVRERKTISSINASSAVKTCQDNAKQMNSSITFSPVKCCKMILNSKTNIDHTIISSINWTFTERQKKNRSLIIQHWLMNAIVNEGFNEKFVLFYVSFQQREIL